MTGLIEQIARAIIISSAGERAADHAQEFDTGNWANAKRAAQAVLPFIAAENERLRGLLTAAAQETVALRVMLGAGCDANNDEHHEIIGTGKDAFCHKCGEMTPRGKSKAWFSEERMERIMNRLAARAALDGK